MLRRVSNPGATPTISANISIPVAATALPIPVRHKGNTGGANGYLSAIDDRLGSIYLSAGHAWMAHTIGVTETGAAGNSRDGVRWYEIAIARRHAGRPANGDAQRDGRTGQQGRAQLLERLDRDLLAGPHRGRLQRRGHERVRQRRRRRLFRLRRRGHAARPDTGDGGGSRLQPGRPIPGSASGRRWGGYSETVMDTCDGTTVWSLQQFVDGTDSYGLQAARVLADPAPPTPVSVSPSAITAGLASVDVVVTGSSVRAAPPIATRPPASRAAIAASIPGVTVNSVTVNSATSVTLNLSTLNSRRRRQADHHYQRRRADRHRRQPAEHSRRTRDGDRYSPRPALPVSRLSCAAGRSIPPP